MKRFRVILLLMGGMALSTTLLSKEIIRSSRSNGNSVFNQKLSEATIFQPSSMGASRGERFQKRTTLPRFSIKERKDNRAGHDVRIVMEKSKKALRKFPVINLATTKTK